MKRDLELFRELLLEIESSTPIDTFEQNSPWIKLGGGGRKYEDVTYHARMLIEQGFLFEDKVQLIAIDSFSRTSVKYQADAITNAGHEFLDDVRDPVVWRKTKERATAAAGVGLQFLWAIAKAEIRTKLGLP